MLSNSLKIGRWYNKDRGDKMPFKSQAQRKKFYAMAARGEISMADVKKWEGETHGKLPKKVKKKR